VVEGVVAASNQYVIEPKGFVIKTYGGKNDSETTDIV
jgi:hypothetical protein